MTHLADPILQSIGSYFLRMNKQDQEAFLYIWDQWIRVLAKLKRRMHEIDASKSLQSLLAEQIQLNMPLVFDVVDATYIRGVAIGHTTRNGLPIPGSNHFVWAQDHLAVYDVAVGDRLLFESGAKTNTNDFFITKLESDGVLTQDVFAPEAGDNLTYRVDRGAIPDPVFVGCAEVFEIPPYVTSIPQLCTSVGPGGRTLVEGADYVIFQGHIGFYDHPPRQFEHGLSFFFAPEAKQDGDVPFHNFGLPIRYRRPTSEDYVRGLQALWFALWNGDAVNNVDVGVAVLFGLPFTRPGTVETISRTADDGYEIVIGGPTYRDVLYLPSSFPPSVAVGDVVGFQALTKASRVIDYLEEPSFIELFDLSPRILKFHTFFVVLGYDAIQARLQDGQTIDFAAVLDFVERIKSKRKDFHLIIELRIRETLGINAETPIVDGQILAHACLGPNYTNLMTIESFGSPGFAYPQGYRKNYQLFDDGWDTVGGTVDSFRDGSDTLLVTWDDVVPSENALVGKFAAKLACSLRASGSVTTNGTIHVLLSTGTFNIARFKPGDTLSFPASVQPWNQTTFQIESVALSGSNIDLTLDRAPQAEVAIGFQVNRYYPILSNKDGRVRLEPATLTLDGLDPVTPGAIDIMRIIPPGEMMRHEYEEQSNTGRVNFTNPVIRDCFNFDSDALEMVDRVRITTYDQDDNVVRVHDQRHLDGDLDGNATPSTPAPTTP